MSDYPESILSSFNRGEGYLTQGRRGTEKIKTDMGEHMFRKEIRRVFRRFTFALLILGICMSVGCEKPEQQSNKEQVTKKVLETHYPEYEDVIVELQFDDLHVSAYQVNKNIDPDRELIWKVEKTGNWSEPDSGLGIGLPRDKVRQILGEPDESEPAVDIYTVNTDGYPPDVYFTYENDKVAGIKWQYYID